MPYLAMTLQPATNIPLSDQTGIDGSYDIKLRFAPDVGQDSTLPSLFTALRETLDLQVKKKQVPMQVLVIDHIDRTPAAK
jgi:uncharacterized protein (TIGR03435 family)